MRLALARALFCKPDLLLLDEPTNMLDMQAIIWLERYLQNWPTTLLVVSHDRNFLDQVPTDMLHLHSQRIDCYRGNYTEFFNTMTERLKAQQREYEAQYEHRKHVQEFIDKFRYFICFFFFGSYSLFFLYPAWLALRDSSRHYASRDSASQSESSFPHFVVFNY